MDRITKFIFLFLSIALFGCSGGGSQGKGLVSSSGRSGELLVVCSDKAWGENIGDSLQEILMQSMLGLPQNEPVFTLSRINSESFTAAYKKQRNILIFDISAENTSPKVFKNKDKWATPQLIVVVSAPTEEEALQQFITLKGEIINYFLEEEIRRFQRAQRAQQDFSIARKLQETYQFSTVFPEGFFFAVKDENFCWLRKETKNWGQSVLIYSQEYTSEKMFSEPYIIALRDSMTKKYVFGSMDSSYMKVEQKYVLPESRYVNFNGSYAIETRGLWKMEGDFMGGPFVNITVLDSTRNRIITLDGFLYAPNDDKRDLLRQVEAILYSTDFNPKKAK